MDVNSRLQEVHSNNTRLSSTKRGSGGSGLGLSIVYNLMVHQLLGSISCQLSIDKGSAFLLKFPIRIDRESGKVRGYVWIG